MESRTFAEGDGPATAIIRDGMAFGKLRLRAEPGIEAVERVLTEMAVVSHCIGRGR